MKGKSKGCIIAIVIIVAWLVVIGLIITSLSKKTEKSGNENNNVSTNVNSQDTIYTIGDDVRVGDVRWKLVSARDRGAILKASESKYPSFANNKTANGKFVEITMEVENLGKEMKSVTNLKIVDNKGREFTAATGVSEWIPDGKDLFLLSNLNPNVPSQFIDIYEVPAEALGFYVSVGDLNIWGNQSAKINLGL